MKLQLIATFLAVTISGLAYAQADNEVICKSIVNAENVKVFEAQACPFGWVTINDED